jgi:hypothetical protein
VRCNLQCGRRSVLRFLYIHARGLRGRHFQFQRGSNVLFHMPRRQLCGEYRLQRLFPVRRRFLCQQRRIERLSGLSGWPDHNRHRIHQLHRDYAASLYGHARLLLRHTGRIAYAMSAGNLQQCRWRHFLHNLPSWKLQRQRGIRFVFNLRPGLLPVIGWRQFL